MQAEADKQPLLRRPNGRPQACDPCRLRKVACDHTQPVCNRCRNRNQAHECVYTVTNNTISGVESAGTRRVSSSSNSSNRSKSRVGRGGRAGLASPSSSSSSASRVPTTTAATVSHPAARRNTAAVLRPGHRPAVRRLEPKRQNNTTGTVANSSSHPGRRGSSSTSSPGTGTTLLPPSRLGYLGFTSYSAVYEETRRSLSHLQGIPPSLQTNDRHKCVRSGGFPWVMSAATREMCYALLRDLPDLSGAHLEIPRFSLQPKDGWVRIATNKILASFQARLPAHRTESQIESLAHMMCSNTFKPVADDLADPNEWIDQFVGDNLRWESLGLLFTFPELFAGRCAVEQCSRSWWHQVSFKQAVLEWIGACIDLCLWMAGGNLMLLHICSRRAILESVTLGDAGLECWRAHAESVAILTFLGLHVETQTLHYKPTFCSELKRKLFAFVFVMDKVMASFQGRPPLISTRYSTTPPPLDIPDLVYFSGEEAVEEFVLALDANGWRRDVEPCSTSLTRGRMLLGYIRDDLLEIALGSKGQPSIATLLSIKSREKTLMSEFPPLLVYDPSDFENLTISAETVYTKTLLQAEHLQNLFFAERLLQRHGHFEEGELLLISYEMITLTLNFWIHKDRFSDIRIDFEWLVMSYAAPGGGILCMELLRPTFTGPRHPRNPSVTRSSMIQHLSVLVSFLAWVGPDAPNADLCASCRTVIQHVLDHTLNNTGSHDSSGGGNGGSGNAPLTEFQATLLEPFDDAMQPYFNFDLLDTFDWLRADEFMSESL